MTTTIVRQVTRMLAGGPGIWLASGEPPEKLTGVVVESSGSTGIPKRIALTSEQLRAAAVASRDRLGWDATWHLALPERYIAGLMVVVRGVLGNGVRLAKDLTDPDLAPGRNVVSLVPTQLIRALEAGAALHKFDAVLVGGAALDPEVRIAAERVGIRIIETYGMSETCGGVVYDGIALPGVEISLESGRIRISGPMVSGGTVLTQDLGQWVRGKLQVLGRVDEMVITGGLKADLAVVRAVAQRIDPDSWVLAVPDRLWGQRIVLFAPSGTLESWRAGLADHLPSHALPREFVRVSELPRTVGGKPDREILLRLLES